MSYRITRRGACLVAALVALCGLPGLARPQDQGNALAAHIDEAQLALPQGLKIARAKGRPVAARFVVDDEDTLRLEVTTVTAKDTVQLLLDPADGAVRKTVAVTDPVALKKMRAATSALAQAAIPLEQAISAAEQDNEGSRLVGVLPTLVKGKAVARVTLLRGTDLTVVEQRLQ